MNNGRGANFLEILAVALIVLKLCGVVTLSWWVILCPIWIPLALCILVLFIVFIAETIRGK